VLAAYFMKDSHHDDRRPPRLRGYTKLVTWSVKHHYITVLIGVGIFAASIWASRCCRKASCRRRTPHARLLAMELPPGSQLAYTEKVTEECRALTPNGGDQKHLVDGGRVPRARSKCGAPR